MALIGDLGKIPRQLEAHPLARADGTGAVALQPIKKIADLNAENLGDFIESTGRNAVNAAFVFMRLLIGDTDQIGKLLLSQTEHDAALAYAGADMAIHILGAAGRAARCGGAVGQVSTLALLRKCFAGLVPLLHMAHSIS